VNVTGISLTFSNLSANVILCFFLNRPETAPGGNYLLGFGSELIDVTNPEHIVLLKLDCGKCPVFKRIVLEIEIETEISLYQTTCESGHITL
jgi:hypothetical protein